MAFTTKLNQYIKSCLELMEYCFPSKSTHFWNTVYLQGSKHLNKLTQLAHVSMSKPSFDITENYEIYHSKGLGYYKGFLWWDR